LENFVEKALLDVAKRQRWSLVLKKSILVKKIKKVVKID
jgi:hypothetical protein